MTPACAWRVPNECTAATIAPQQVLRQRSPHSLLRARRPMARAPNSSETCLRTRAEAGAWQQSIALAPRSPFGEVKQCVGRRRSSPLLAARAALQWRPPPDGGARRRAESKAIAVELGASRTCCTRPDLAPGQCPALKRPSWITPCDPSPQDGKMNTEATQPTSPRTNK